MTQDSISFCTLPRLTPHCLRHCAQVFGSHVGWKSTGMCTWDPEYGDGYFQIDQNILGDFAIICRFGGQLANTREKSTLIFKYQNTTGERFG